MDKELLNQIYLLNEKQNREICTIKNELVCLNYGNLEYRFNPRGFSFLYNMYRLYNNEVIRALLV